MDQKDNGLARFTIYLVLLFILFHVSFLIIHSQINGMDGAITSQFAVHAPAFAGFLTPGKFHLIAPMLKFIGLVLLVYATYGFLLWYMADSVSRGFNLKRVTARYVLYCIWLLSIVTILAGNMYFVPYSFFSTFFQQELLASPASENQLAIIFYSSLSILALTCLFSLVLTIFRVTKQSLLPRDGLLAALIIFVVWLSTPASINTVSKNVATSTKPNVILIGFDAMRPDYLSFFDKRRKPTPNFDAFLQEAVVFDEAYTPDARTFPTWMTILTANYPLQHKGRDDNADLASLHYDTTLALELKKNGYETIYASDDNRFNNVNQDQFGFNKLIGPTGNAVDMIVSGMDDTPLTNLVMMTRAGKAMFADYIGNHGTPHLYEPNDFMPYFAEQLAKRDQTKPLFLAAHFNITAWPFFFLNDARPSNDSLTLYKTSIDAGDKQFADLLAVLKQQQLLKNTIFVLISDHGITMQMPNDRLVTTKLYQGDKRKMMVKRTPYRHINFAINSQRVSDNDGESKVITVNTNNDLSTVEAQQRFIQKLESPLNPARYGIDTSWGYGNDLLSLKQNKALVSIRFYDVPLAAPHRVSGKVLLMDIAPTILDLLNVNQMPNVSGISLKPSVIHLGVKPDQSRPLFLESSFTIPEIEQGDISVDKVLLKAMKFYRVNPDNALLSILLPAEQISINNKQRAIIQGDWMLAYYPSSVRDQFDIKTGGMEQTTLPPYSVLVNLTTGDWTTDFQLPLVKQAPVATLRQQLEQFYGDEMRNYDITKQSTRRST